MERPVPIETDLGIITMRDGILLDQVLSDGYHMIFTGEINGNLVSRHRDEKEWFPYTLTFHGVLTCLSCELDTYENMGDISFPDGSDFDMIEESAWLQSLPVRKDYDKDQYHHYRVSTYDMIYNIIAKDYDMNIDIKSADRTNEQRAEELIRRLGFDFTSISKIEIRTLIEQEIAHFQEGSSEYIRLLCGYLYCIGDITDVPLLEKAKYGINMDVGCMIDGEWIDSLKNGGQKTETVNLREDIIKAFVTYYENDAAEDDRKTAKGKRKNDI